MNKKYFLAGEFVGIILLVGIQAVVLFAYIHAHNTAINYEERLIASRMSIESLVGQYSQSIAEMAQVPTMQRDDLKAVLREALMSRYGENGSQALMQWIHESNLSLDQATFVQIQQAIEAGRRDIHRANQVMIDIHRAYRAALRSFITGRLMRAQDFPRIDLDKYKPITSEYAREAMESGVSAPVQLR